MTVQPIPRFIKIGDIIINLNKITHIDLAAVRYGADDSNTSIMKKTIQIKGIAIYAGEIENGSSTWTAFIPDTDEDAKEAFFSYLIPDVPK